MVAAELRLVVEVLLEAAEVLREAVEVLLEAVALLSEEELVVELEAAVEVLRLAWAKSSAGAAAREKARTLTRAIL